MKKITYLFAFALLAACTADNGEEIIEQSNPVDKVLAVMDMEPDPQFEKSESGLFKGIIASYDLKTKGTLVINTTKEEGLVAAASLHKVTDGLSHKLLFYGSVHPNNNKRYIFSSDRGTFTVELNKEGRLIAEHFDLDGTDSYVVAYKRTRGSDVSLAMGTFDDDYDTSGGFEGNWDAIHRGSTYVSPAGEHHPARAETLLMIDEIVITRGGNIYINEDGTQDDDSFTEPCYYAATFPHAWFFDQSVMTNRSEFIGYNQTTIFAGRVATWSLSVYQLGGDALGYGTPSCFLTEADGHGSFSWNGNNGSIRVDEIQDFGVSE